MPTLLFIFLRVLLPVRPEVLTIPVDSAQIFVYLDSIEVHTGVDSAQIIVSLDSIEIHTEESFAISVRISGDSLLPFSSYQFTLSYDPLLIRPDSIDVSETLSASSLLFFSDQPPGLMHVAAASSIPITEEGLLLKLVFSSLTEEGTSSIHFDSFQFQEGTPKALAKESVIHIKAPPADTTWLKLDSVSVTTGEVAPVGVYIDSEMGDIVSGTFSVAYDPEVITPRALQYEHTLLEHNSGVADFTVSQPGTINLSFATLRPITDNKTPLLYIEFDGPEFATETSLTLTEAALNEVDLFLLFLEGKIRFIPSIIWGDIDENKEITAADARLILSHVLGRTELHERVQQAADVSGNDLVSSFDAALVLMYVYHVIDCFPADLSCSDSSVMLSKKPGGNNGIIPFTFSPGNTPDAPALIELAPIRNPVEIYAVDIVVTRTSPEAAPFTITPSLPDSWLYNQLVFKTKQTLSMAGPTRLPEGALLSIPAEEWKSIDSIQITINGTESYHLTPDEVSHDRASLTELTLYPHPFTHRARLTYTLHEAGVIEICMYDMLGRNVKTLFKGEHQAGTHQLLIEGDQLSSGFYTILLKKDTGDRYIKNIIKR